MSSTSSAPLTRHSPHPLEMRGWRTPGRSTGRKWRTNCLRRRPQAPVRFAKRMRLRAVSPVCLLAVTPYPLARWRRPRCAPSLALRCTRGSSRRSRSRESPSWRCRFRAWRWTSRHSQLRRRAAPTPPPACLSRPPPPRAKSNRKPTATARSGRLRGRPPQAPRRHAPSPARTRPSSTRRTGFASIRMWRTWSRAASCKPGLTRCACVTGPRHSVCHGTASSCAGTAPSLCGTWTTSACGRSFRPDSPTASRTNTWVGWASPR
mmetsp:Transcript_10226/g.32821  ORF Transcript_10226/g.32821 Transcript_10226/m.32821 type:complete len:263 (+) Transcript_10226:472-1260(+)